MSEDRQSHPVAEQTAARPVVRARASAPHERSTLVLRPPQFFELALPIIGADEHDETEAEHQAVYPPAGSVLRLTSQGGYEREIRISQGVCTGDGFCSFRFYDIDESHADDLFTARLEWPDGEEVIFKDKRIATYIAAAKSGEKYQPTFGPGPRDEYRESPTGHNVNGPNDPVKTRDADALRDAA